MPLLKYFRSLRGKSRRNARGPVSHADSAKDYLEPSGQRDDLLAAQKFFAEQETTCNLGDKKRRGKLKKHISGIFII